MREQDVNRIYKDGKMLFIIPIAILIIAMAGATYAKINELGAYSKTAQTPTCPFFAH